MSFSHFVCISVSNIYPLVNSNMVYEKGSIYVFLASRSFGESVSQSTLYQIFTFSHIMHCKHVIFTFCMYFRFKYTPLVNSNMVYEKGSIYVFLASRSFGESVSQSTLYQIFTFSHIMHCKHVIFTFCMYFRFKYTPLVNSNMVYEKGSIYVFLASRSFGESVSQSTLYQIFTFSHIMHCKHVIFTFCMYFRFKYTPLVNSTMVYEKGLFTSFWHREVSGKVFLRALYIKFSHFPI